MASTIESRASEVEVAATPTRDEAFVGREAELDLLFEAATSPDTRVVHVTGVAGVGKSRLMNVWASRAVSAGVRVIRLDGRSTEPSAEGVLRSIAAETHGQFTELDGLRRAPVGSPPTSVVVDTYEHLRLADSFVREELVPALPEHWTLVTAGRDRPTSPWFADEHVRGRLKLVTLGALSRRDSMSYLLGLGLDDVSAKEVFAAARGHPLALTMAAGVASAPGGADALRSAAGAAVDRLAVSFLATVTDDQTRLALEALSVVRRVTESLSSAILPELNASEVVGRLEALPFAEVGADGVHIHDAVRDAIADRLASVAPQRYQQYRRAAWHQLRAEMTRVPASVYWRYTADILHLMDAIEVREAFFPLGQQPLIVEPAARTDEDCVHRIIAAHCGPEEQRALLAWWDCLPDRFHVCRDESTDVVGFCIQGRRGDLGQELIGRDPVAQAWRQSTNELEEGREVFYFRRLLARDFGEQNDGVIAAFGLDLKRSYMEMRPKLRYLHVAGADPSNFEWATALGFDLLSELHLVMDGVETHTWRLDMGPESVDGWLSRLAAEAIGIDDVEQAEIFDRANLEVVLPDGERRHLTPLEFGVLDALWARDGRPASRADLILEVWGFDSDATSNVVDTVVAGLRRKLGPMRSVVETVRGTGYRYRRG